MEVPANEGRFDPALPIDNIKPSKTNPRRTFDDMERMTASIRVKGVLQPIVVRPIRSGLATNAAQQDVVEALGLDPDQKFELVCGERRWRGAKQAALKSIPAIIRDLTDAQVIEIQVIENNQRRDVHPLEEADGVHMLKKLGMDDAMIAGKLGWTESYTANRLRLSHLAPIWRQTWLKSEVGMSVSHATQIARLSEPQQLKLHDRLKRHYSWPQNLLTLDSLKREIFEMFHRNLADAPWKLDDVELHKAMGACNACQHNSKYQAALFDDVKGALCLKPDCFAAKQQAYVQLQITAVKSGGDEPVMISHHYGKERPKGAVGVHDVQEISKAEAKKLPAAQVKTAVVVDGEDAGKTVVVRVNPAAASTSKADVSRAAQQKRMDEKSKRETALNAAVLDAILKDADPLSTMAMRVIAPSVFERLWDDYKKKICARHGWEKPKNAGYDNWKLKAVTKFIDGCTAAECARFMLELTLFPWVKVDASYARGDSKKLAIAAGMLGIDVDQVREKFNAAQDSGTSPTKPVVKLAKKSSKKVGRR